MYKFRYRLGRLQYNREMFTGITRERALDLAIEKWELVAKHPYADNAQGRYTCALCRLYNRDAMMMDERCKGCPVSERTGLPFCFGTPFEEFHKALEEGIPEEPDRYTLSEIALKEVEFLKSLKGS